MPKTVLKSQFLWLWFSLIIRHSVPDRAEHQSRVEQNCRCRRTAHKSLQRSSPSSGPPPYISKAGARDHSLSTSRQRDAYASGYTSQTQLAFLRRAICFFGKWFVSSQRSAKEVAWVKLGIYLFFISKSHKSALFPFQTLSKRHVGLQFHQDTTLQPLL